MSASKVTPLPRRSFLYSDVAAELRRRIANGTYNAGGRLPSLGDLKEEFRVSAITVRRALRELSYEGLIYGHQGLGVFVKEKQIIHRVLAGDPERVIGDEIARAGFTPRIAELVYTQVEADAELAARHGIAPGARLCRHEKLTFADSEPVALHVLHMSPGIARRLRGSLATEFIFRLLQKRGIEVRNLKCEFSAVAVSEDHSRLFGLPAGSPLMRVDYTPTNAAGAVVLTGITICRADRFTFEVNLPQRPPSRRRRGRSP